MTIASPERTCTRQAVAMANSTSSAATSSRRQGDVWPVRHGYRDRDRDQIVMMPVVAVRVGVTEAQERSPHGGLPGRGRRSGGRIEDGDLPRPKLQVDGRRWRRRCRSMTGWPCPGRVRVGGGRPPAGKPVGVGIACSAAKAGRSRFARARSAGLRGLVVRHATRLRLVVQGGGLPALAGRSASGGGSCAACTAW